MAAADRPEVCERLSNILRVLLVPRRLDVFVLDRFPTFAPDLLI